MRFAYIFKSGTKDIVHHTTCQSGSSQSVIYSVYSFEQAAELSKDLVAQGIECIELCGAFQEEGKQIVVDAIDCNVPVGHVVYTGSEVPKHQKLFNH